MKKKTCLLFTVIILCFSFSFFASATADDYYTEDSTLFYSESVDEYQSAETVSGQRLIASLAVGYGMGFLVIWSIASKNKSVRMQENATVYTRPGSFVVTGRYDNFLYKKVDRTAKPKSNDKK